MATFIIRRIIWTIPVILLVIFMTFVMMRQIGGNPFRKTERNVPVAIQRNLERKFNLDEPWYMQYVYYVKNVATFDLGPSMSQRTRTVNDIIKDGFPKSLKLGILAFLWAVVLGIPLGVLWPRSSRTRSSTTSRCSSRPSASRYRASSSPRCLSTTWR
jgi:ABC-type dipeptide/oligopeptide/nickel transport system permease component